MMDLFTTLLGSILSGGATGLLGVLIQRWFDFKNRQQDVEIVKLNHANAIALAGIESARAQKVAEVRADADMAVAASDAQAREAEADSKSLVASFEHDQAAYLEPGAQKRKGFIGGLITVIMALVDFARGILRPGMTIYLCGVTTMMFLWVRELAAQKGVELDKTQIMQLLMLIINTVLYVFTTAALWWFGTRPPKRQGDA